jgi:hypothetical protein
MPLFVLTVGFAVLALYPGTSWSVRNQVDGLLGRLGSIEPFDAVHYETSEPDRDPGPWPYALRRPRGHQLMDALLAAQPVDLYSESTRRSDLGPLTAYCRAHPKDPGAWAHLARLCDGAYWVPEKRPDSPPMLPEPTVLQAYARQRKLAFEATDNGTRLQPKNAFFHMLRATALQAGGEPVLAQDAWAAAADAEYYDDHADDEMKLREETGLRVAGYRGHFSLMSDTGDTALPHILRVKLAIGAFPWKHQGVRELELRHNMLLALHKVRKMPIVLSAAAAVRDFIIPRGDRPTKDPRWRDPEFRKAWFDKGTAAFDKALAASGLAGGPSAAKVLEDLAGRGEEFKKKLEEIDVPNAYGQGFSLATALLSVGLALVGFLVGASVRASWLPTRRNWWWLNVLKLIVAVAAVIAGAVWLCEYPGPLSLLALFGWAAVAGFVLAVSSKGLVVGGTVLMVLWAGGYGYAVGWDLHEDARWGATYRLLMADAEGPVNR